MMIDVVEDQHDHPTHLSLQVRDPGLIELAKIRAGAMKEPKFGERRFFLVDLGQCLKYRFVPRQEIGEDVSQRVERWLLILENALPEALIDFVKAPFVNGPKLR